MVGGFGLTHPLPCAQPAELHPCVCIPSPSSFPGQAWPGVSPWSSPRVQLREKRSPLTPQSPSVSIPPSPAEPFPLAQEAAGKREQQAPQTCHCAKCFQTLQDVTVSQFQFIRWRREDAVTSKPPFPYRNGSSSFDLSPQYPPQINIYLYNPNLRGSCA